MKKLSKKITESKFKTLSAKEKNELKKQAAHRILASFGTCARSWNYATTYGFSFDNRIGRSKLYDEVQKFLDKEGIKYTLGAGSTHLQIRISVRGDNLDKFVKLGERAWEKVLKLYLPMLDELEKIQDKIDSSKCKSTYRFNYIVYRTGFADYYRDELIKDEVVHNYEQMIKNYSRLLEVQNDVEKVKAAYDAQKHGPLGQIDASYMNLLADEYERLTGKHLD